MRIRIFSISFSFSNIRIATHTDSVESRQRYTTKYHSWIMLWNVDLNIETLAMTLTTVLASSHRKKNKRHKRNV